MSRAWLAALALAVAPGYEPPVETAGPLTVRILEPSLGTYGAGGPVGLNRTEAPFTVTVSLENAGEAALRGTLRLGVIDRWRVTPAEAVPFEVAARGRSRLEFQVAIGEGTYNAHYPVHAFAEFEHAGKKYAAHPILILQTRLPNPPRASVPFEWKPLEAPVALWRVPVHRESAEIALGGETHEAAPPVQFGVRHAGRDAVRMTLGPRAPAMVDRVERARTEWPLAVPRAGAKLRFGYAGEAVMRVKVDGATVWERQAAATEWHAGEADLAPFAGKAVRLALEAEGSGTAYWAEPFVGEPDASSRGLLTREVQVAPGLSFHGFRVQVLGDALDDPRSAARLIEVREEGGRVRHRFRTWAGTFDLMGELRRDGAIRARFWLENTPPPKPWLHVYLESVSSGPWSAAAERVYAGPGNVIERPKAFRLGFDGHNMATSYVGLDFPGVSVVQAVDAVPDRLEVDPEARIYSFNTPHSQTITFLPAANVWEGVKAWREINGKRASAGVKHLAGRFVFDLWGMMPYPEAARQLEKAFSYGLTDAVVVWHNWQRWGYDYRLPDIFPPNPRMGTSEDYAALAALCRKHGVLFAPHDNYIDFYPDSEGFTYQNMVFNRDGSPRRAWFNSGRQAQSYRVRADRLRPFLERNVKLIRDAIHPNAYFIDVWSSMAPYDFWTHDGRFVERPATRQEWGEAFAWIRDFMGGAVQISEAGHDQLIGWLDGAQAQHMRVGKPGSARGFYWAIDAEDAERTPWFDAAWHDLFILHGAGYQDRYAAGLDLKTHGMYSDDYIATEVLMGHPAMVPAPFNRDVVRKYWLLHDIMKALALRRLEGVEYAGGNLHRQHVRWSGGAEVWVNRGPEPWPVGERVLPQYGFYGRAGAVEAGRDQTGEWSRSPEAVYDGRVRKAAGGREMLLP